MKPTDTLITKYDIVIPFYTSENVTKSVRNIYDHELCKEVIRLYLLNNSIGYGEILMAAIITRPKVVYLNIIDLKF